MLPVFSYELLLQQLKESIACDEIRCIKDDWNNVVYTVCRHGKPDVDVSFSPIEIIPLATRPVSVLAEAIIKKIREADLNEQAKS
jgi:hypothetical protein